MFLIHIIILNYKKKRKNMIISEDEDNVSYNFIINYMQIYYNK